jgi:hypothetical protein
MAGGFILSYNHSNYIIKLAASTGLVSSAGDGDLGETFTEYFVGAIVQISGEYGFRGIAYAECAPAGKNASGGFYIVFVIISIIARSPLISFANGK